MLTLRSLLFTAWLYLSMPIFAIGLSPALLMPHRFAMGVVKLWARTALFGLRWIAGVRVELRGLRNMPSGAALVAGFRQAALERIFPGAAKTSEAHSGARPLTGEPTRPRG